MSAARALHPSAAGSSSDVGTSGADTSTHGPLDTSILRDIAAGLAQAVDVGGAGQTGDGPGPWEVRSTRLLTTDAYDVWCMVWGAAALSAAHDHDGSVGVVQVVTGALLETSLSIDSAVPAPLRRLGPGDVVEFAAAEFHSLFNPTSSETITVNVYSPPLGEPPAS